MSISINEFKANIERYIILAQTEDLYIQIDGNVVMKLSNTNSDRRKLAESLLGAVPADVSWEQARQMKADEL